MDLARQNVRIRARVTEVYERHQRLLRHLPERFEVCWWSTSFLRICRALISQMSLLPRCDLLPDLGRSACADEAEFHAFVQRARNASEHRQ